MTDPKTILDALNTQTSETHTLLDGVNHQFRVPEELGATLERFHMTNTLGMPPADMNRFAAISEEMNNANDYDIVAEFLRTMTPVPAHHFVGPIYNRTGTYFTPNPISSVPNIVGQATIDVLVREYRTLWFEIDPASPPANSGERAYVKRDQRVFIRRMIEGLGLPAPTFTVWSGNKSTHAFWRINRPMTKIEWHSMQRGLIYAFNGDPVALTPSSLARVPTLTSWDRQRVMAADQSDPEVIDWQHQTIRTAETQVHLSSRVEVPIDAFEDIAIPNVEDEDEKSLTSRVIRARYTNAESAMRRANNRLDDPDFFETLTNARTT